MQIFKQLRNQQNCVLFFGGFGSHPSHFLPFIPKCYDCVMLYNYTHLNFDALLECLKALPKDSQITLIAFSMGVFVARIFRTHYPLKLLKSFAINGTEYGIHPKYGIPEVLFKRTHQRFITQTNALETFKKNLFAEQLETACNFIFLEPKVLCNELEFFRESCAKHQKITIPISWDFAWISLRDLIINPNAQKHFWQEKDTTIITLDAPHFMFFNRNPLCP